MNAEASTTTLFGQRSITLARAIALLLAQGAVFTAAGVGLWLWSGRSGDAFVTMSVTELELGAAFGAALVLAAATVFKLFPEVGEQLIRLQADSYRFLGPELGWPAIVLISAIAGISEEALMRAGWQTLLGDYVGAPGAIIIASALFAALHLARPLITALLFVIGVLFGIVYWQTSSLLAVVIAHVLYDIWALRYLNRETHRLSLFDDPAPLANPADPR